MSFPTLRRVALLLGSNLEPARHLPLALARLAERFPLERVSSVWQSPAVGSHGPDFWNATVVVRTPMSPPALKHQVLRPLEAKLGRVRTANKYAPRNIDLDVVVWGGRVIDPEVWRYAHIAVPLAELLPDLHHPETGEPLCARAARLAASAEIHRLEGASLDLAASLTLGLFQVA